MFKISPDTGCLKFQ